VVPFKIDYAPIDSMAPVITVTKPVDGYNWTGGTMDLVFSATDNIGVTSLQAYGNNQNWGSANGSSFSRTMEYSWFQPGPMRLDLYAFDADGNYGKKTINITLGGTTDVTKPTITIPSPSANANVLGSFAFNASASDNIGVSRVEFSGTGISQVTDTTSPYTSVIDVSQLPNGSRSFQATAFDAAGNSASASVAVNVQNQQAQSFGIESFTVGQNKTVTDTTKRNWIDLKLVNVIGNPTFQGRAVTNTAWSTKAGADAVKQANGDWRIFFFNANTNYEVKAICGSCSPYAEKIQAFKSLP